MPLNQQIEGGDGERQPGLQVVDHPMHHFFGMADQREHGIDRFNHHPVVPGAARAQFQVRRITLVGMKAGIGQDQHPILEHLDQRLKQRIVDVGRRAQPADDAAPLIDQQTELVTYNPAVVGFALAADLARTASLANRVDQFDPGNYSGISL